MTTRLPAALLAIVFLIPLLSWAGERVYFYSPESGINNFKVLKTAFDRYLSGYGSYEFQPFRQQEAFQDQVGTGAEGAVLLSGWHYRQIHREYGLEALAVGTKNGETVNRRILVGAVGKRGKPVAGVVATAFDPALAEEALEKMLGSDRRKKVEALAVPKDIDALMSVGFGMADYALTTRAVFRETVAINAGLGTQLEEVAAGGEAFHLVLAVPAGKVPKALVDALFDMPETAEGKKNMGMLGLDGWHRIDGTEKARLEGRQ